MLRAACYSLFVVCCLSCAVSLCVVLVFVACWSLFVARCLLLVVVCGLMFAVCGLLCVV